GYKFDEWEVYNKSIFAGPDAKNTALNLKLHVHFAPFSCCSAACCDKNQCGEHLFFKDEACRALKSVKTRYGHLVVLKERLSQPVKNISGVDSEG
ncbi:hypothetical protein PMAYCL1PPCAC_26741, partial [Pristionchus mayeri]